MLRKTLIETKHRTLKKLKMAIVRSMKSIAGLSEDGAFALFFVPTPGDLTAQESLSPGICHPSQKECYAAGAARGGLGAAGID